jgi:hypothetical protein
MGMRQDAALHLELRSSIDNAMSEVRIVRPPEQRGGRGLTLGCDS